MVTEQNSTHSFAAVDNPSDLEILDWLYLEKEHHIIEHTELCN